MHELAFADAVRPARAVILFLPMRNYSLGHELLLLQQRNAFLLTGFDSLPEEQKRLALVRAADVCSQTWSENHFTPGTWWDKTRMRKVWARWQRAVKCGVRSEERGVLADGCQPDGAHGVTRPTTTWGAEIAKLREYIRAGSTKPTTEACDGPAGRQHGAPFHASLIQFLISQMGLPEMEAYDYPFGLAKFHYYTHAEAEGGIKIVNAPEMEFEEFCAREDAKAAQKSAESKAGTTSPLPSPPATGGEGENKEAACRP